jgi:transcriptional regulator with XRE-family HTH domain
MGGKELRALLSMNLKLLRNRRGWSQATLAGNSGISIPFLSDIERGNKWPYPETLTNLAKALDIEVFELFKRKEPIENDITTILEKCLDDVSITLRQSVGQSIEQSLEKIRGYYTSKSIETVSNQFLQEAQ